MRPRGRRRRSRARPLPGRRPRSGGSAIAVCGLACVLSLGSLGLACGGAAPAQKTGSAPGARRGPVVRLPAYVTPSWLVPDVSGEQGVHGEGRGETRLLVDRMRVALRDDGTIARARELLPPGVVTSSSLPPRLGGGFLFHLGATGGETRLWRARGWLDELEPLAQVGAPTSEVVAGFDRLYLRLASSGQLVALDPRRGERMPLGPLPPTGYFGALAFADGWRAVVDVDLRGPLVTFDAGQTWRRLGLGERAMSVDVVDGDPVVTTASGRHAVDARGALRFRPPAEPRAEGEGEDALPAEGAAAKPAGPFGKRPLRAAIEDGFPESAKTAIVARAGSLGRISLEDGAILEVRPDAYRERLSTCHAVRLGTGFGFVCGEPDGPTTIYAFEPPLAMRPVQRFASGRLVLPNGRGALAVRGGCTDEARPEEGSRLYCVRASSGETREVRVRGELGVERVVALSDGRVAILVPPRPGAAGQLSLVRGTEVHTVPLALPAESGSDTEKAAAKLARRGSWLEGFEEREDGAIGGWIEAGGPVVGVEVGLDGKVRLGEPRGRRGDVVFGGRFAVAPGEAGLAHETVDGGFTWKELELPDRDVPPRASPTRSCGPVGCVLGGWLRAGWGEPRSKEDLAKVEPPPHLDAPLTTSHVLSFRCEAAGAVPVPPAPRTRPKPRASTKLPPPRGYPHVLHGLHGPHGYASYGSAGAAGGTAWLPFKGLPGPELGDDEVGFDHGTDFDLRYTPVAVRAYAWGKRGADWSRVGKWLVRFDDRFDTSAHLRSSAVTASPFADEMAAAEGLGARYYSGHAWSALLDPSGKGALAQVCRGLSCAIYAVIAGQPVLSLRDAQGRSGTLPRPLGPSVARLGETWFFLALAPGGEGVTLWRADLGVARPVETYPRPLAARYGAELPRLVRRASSPELGLLFDAATEPGDRAGTFYVMPIDAESGALGEPVSLVRGDLRGLPLSRCAEDRDGWVVETALDVTPRLALPSGSGFVEGVEMRLRLDPGQACVDGMAARTDRAPGASAAPGGAGLGGSIPLAANDRATGRRHLYRCALDSP